MRENKTGKGAKRDGEESKDLQRTKSLIASNKSELAWAIFILNFSKAFE